MKNENHRLNISAGILSVLVALVLVLAKLWALRETGALAVAATLADSALDLMMSLGGLAAIRYAARPADEDHVYGHTSAEDLAALGQSLFILGSAIAIAVAAFLRLSAPDARPLAAESAGIAVMVFSIALTLVLVLWQRHVARRTGNQVVAADSLHYIGDMIPNAGAIVALWAAQSLGWQRVDSFVALLAALIMVRGAIVIGKGAWDALMDRSADPAVLESVTEITANFPGVFGFHDLKTRRAGSRIFITLHVELDGAQTLDEAHGIGAALRRAILAAHPNADVMLHKDPVGVAPHPDDPTKTT